eukprot:TRINITY_DN8646_c0_g1_i1.p1 TRINITY_DN8646_c0_g1~~TRINITY_DN8646_c0_g1_i1.p1  ORF type:complete len:305 (-),score=32.64 TRINITY_DN8646_c0_g1_i1:107-1021(-)
MARSHDLELGHLQPANPLPRTCQLHEAPEHLRDNPHVLTGYRSRSWHSSAPACARSVLQLHNETGNIWTHLLALVYTLVLHAHTQLSPQLLLHPRARWASAASMTAFCLAAECCFLFSVLYHTFRCHSGRAFLVLLQLDQVGIILLVVCSFLPGLQLGFYCRPGLFALYSTIVMAALAVGLLLIAMQARYPYWEGLQHGTQAFFVGTAAFGLIPAGHFVYLHGMHSEEASYVWYLLGMFASFGIGFGLFRTRMPERFSPGLFDVLFASHQLWHICVAVGAYVWYIGLNRFLFFRLHNPGTCIHA